jgi:predicted permease
MLLNSLVQDVRIGLRILAKDKSFCFLAVLILGFGICGVTTQFAVVNAFVLRGFSFPEPEKLMRVGLIDPGASQPENNFGIGSIPSSQDYEDLRTAQQSFAQMSAYLNGSTVNVSYHGNPQHYTGAYVTEDFFKIIGVSPILGRDFTADDNKPGAEKVAILGYEIWQRDFDGDSGIIGQAVRINGRPATIIGVMPAGFKFPMTEEIWVPLFNEYPLKPRGDPTNVYPRVFGRLKPSVSIHQASAELVGLAKRLAKDNPKTNGQLVSASVQPLLNAQIGPQLRQTVYAMLGAVLIVLLVACVNVMNMQFGRTTLRSKELAIRGALGATRWRLVRQMVTESLLVVVMGASLGLTLAFWALKLLIRATDALPFPRPYWVVFNIDASVLVFTVAVSLMATVISGVAPALLSSRRNPAVMMKESGLCNSISFVNVITRLLVIGQIALTTALLIAAVLQIRSIRNQVKLDYGYDESGIYCARVDLFAGDYPGSEARQQFLVRALRALRSNPAFENAAMSGRFRMTFGDLDQYEVDGKAYVTNRDRPLGNLDFVSDGYFATIGLKILQGRDFTINDTDAKQPVAIVSSAFAKKYWGAENPVGHHVRRFNPAEPQPWCTIIGVVPDTLMQGPFDQRTDESGFYLPILAVSPAPRSVSVIVRPHAGQRAETLAAPLSKSMADLDSNLPIYAGGTPASLHDHILGWNRIIALLFTIFGMVAFVLSAVGVYGVMSFSVNQRTHEFGIRMALGADATCILRTVMMQGAWQVLMGLALGIGTTVILFLLIGQTALKDFLFRVNALDPFIYCAVAVALSMVAATSCFIPARRATRVNPMIALQTE